jgi:hypothetical protein
MNTEHFKARVVKQNGGIPHASNHYELVTTYRPSNIEINDAQRSLGYDPKGYGGPVYISRKQLTNGKWVTTWESQSSCD